MQISQKQKKKLTDEQTEQNEQNITNKENIVKKREGIRSRGWTAHCALWT